MITKVSDHLGRPWPSSVTFDGNQLVTSLPCGVTAAAGTHPPKVHKVPLSWMIRDFISLKPHLWLLGMLDFLFPRFLSPVNVTLLKYSLQPSTAVSLTAL